jgi:uncharacterized protein (TIGR00645 family)
MAEAPSSKPALARLLELWLFRSRWLLAPIYIGLTVALAGLVVVMAQELFHAVSDVEMIQPKYIIVTTLSMIDVSLAANLVLIVILSGYEQFVARIDTGEGNEDGRLSWMKGVDFSGLKLRLIASLVAISAVVLLREFVEIADEAGAPTDRKLAWMIGIHLTFVVSGLLLAVMDYVISKTDRA